MTTDELVDEIFARCRERIERGEVVDVEEIVRAHADLAGPLRERFAAVRLLERAGARRRRDPAAASRIGTALGRYRIESILGAGGMGTVYLARVEGPPDAVAAGESVALKVFHPFLVTRERFAARFLREAELGRRVRHPNVVRTLDADEALEADVPVRFLVMEHVQGRTLRALLAESGRQPEGLVRHVGREVAKGLSAIHAAGAVHRDLKPENVIVTKDHVVKVMDLGVARVEDAVSLSDSGAFVGSLRYGAPEQFGRGGGVDPRADLHALGLLLYELATGVHPFAGDEFHEVVGQVLTSRPRRCGEIVPQLSPFLEELVAQLLEKDREKRPANADAVAEILERGEESPWWKERAAAIRRETRRPLRRIRIPRETALYGRDGEIARLRGLYEKARGGEGQIVLVEGEAGIGKSRLVDEFVLSLWAAGEDIDFLFGSYPPGGAASASGAFSTAYREHLGDDEAAIQGALCETPLLVPAFAALLRGDAPPEGAPRLSADSIRTLFVHATRSFAAKRTTIVLIDDLHFAPQEGRAIFAALALAAPGNRVLLVGGARPSLDEKWVAGLARLPNSSRLPLQRLSPKELVALLKDALGSEHLATELAGKIGEKSDGNPFFVFEILRGLREGNFLTRTPEGTWITTRSILEIEVPPSIVEVIQARVLDLDEVERNTLEVAACVGFEFDAALVGTVLGVAPIPVLQRLGRIEKAHRLVRSVGHRFQFDHHQVQEVLYAGLSGPLREAYHAAIGEVLESRSGAAAREVKELDGVLCVALAEHLLRGAKGADALRYLDAALLHLARSYLNDAGIRLAECALAVPGLLVGKERVHFLLRMNARLNVLGRRAEQVAALDEARSIAEGLQDVYLRITTRRAQSEYLARMSRFAEAESALRDAMDLARAAGDRNSESAAAGALGSVLWSMGRSEEAQAHLERRMAHAREIGDRTGEAEATLMLGNVSHSRGDVAESQALFERCLAIVCESGDREGEAVARGNLGLGFQGLGRYAEAQRHFEQALALARETGGRRHECIASSNLGGLFCALGRYAESQAPLERSLALAREIGDRWSEADFLGSLGLLWLALGDAPRAQTSLEASLAISREIGARSTEGHTLLGLASVADEEGDPARALALAEEALALLRGIGVESVPESLIALADLRWGAGDADGARAALEESVALVRRQGRRGKIALGLALLARLPGGDPEAAEAALSEAGDALEWQESIRVRFLLWQATRDPAHLAGAKSRLDVMVEHAPPTYRESMLANVRLHREILGAWREHGATT